MELTIHLEVTAINKKTQAKGLKAVKVGDKVTLAWGLGGHYKGAPYVDVYLNGEYADHKNADTVYKLFKGYNKELPNFTTKECEAHEDLT